jgi:uncharacterized protein (UPF0264 family)
MRLLVSVATAADARAAVEGGADIVDAKDPGAGALGAVTLERFAGIRDAVAGARPLTAALGDAADAGAIAHDARAFAAAGASLVKLGLLGTTDPQHAAALLAAAVRAVADLQAGVIAVAYADAGAGAAPHPQALIDIAARAGARGVLIDTMDKSGPGLLDVMSWTTLGDFVAVARSAGLLVAAAGKLRRVDVATIAALGADVVGVRGAACTGGRHGRISAGLVRQLAPALRSLPG